MPAMKMPRSYMLMAVAVAAAACTRAGAITPTQKVIQMLTEMKAKGEQATGEEQKVYAAYAEWVDDQTKQLGFEIQEGASRSEELKAYITKAESDAQELGAAIVALNAEIDKLSAEKKEATEIRKTEHAEYLKVSEDYAESVDALDRAIQVLTAQSYDRAQAEALLQRMATTVRGMPRVLAAYLQERERGASSDSGAPEVAAYEFQSGGIVALLQGLHQKFKAELAAVEEAESNEAHEFSLAELHLSDTITKDTSDRDGRAMEKGQRAADSAKAQGELSEVLAGKKADESLKAEMEATLTIKTAAYQENQKVRAAELEAIAKAIEIISSPAVAGSYAKHVNLAQLGAAGRSVALLQLGRSSRRVAAKQQAFELLRKRGRALHSKALAAVATEIAANPFAKVVEMVERLIEKLKAEAAAEADHKGWCDEQLKANKLKRNKKTAEANKLVADIEGLAASIAQMGATIDKLVAEQAALTKAMSEATAQRQAENARNTAAIADASAGMEAVRQALVVLREFYSSQASLLQQVPEMAAYRGMQGSTGGVIGMLEVIETDFARLRADTQASEKDAATEYGAFMEDSAADQKQKHEAEVKLKLEKDQAEYERGETEKDLGATQEELAKADQYFDYLKPSCLEVHVSYKERVAKRKEEVAALNQAYEILDLKSSE